MKAETPSPERPRRKKSLGQHHLREGSLCRPLLEFLFAGLTPAGSSRPFVVEIGPGGGVLTTGLLAAGAEVLALELDPEWAEELQLRIRDARLSVKVGDVLDFDWAVLPPGTLVCGNLPYQLGTAIVDRVLRAHPLVERAAFLLQREVVDRLTAGPGDAEYGSLSLLTQARASVARLGIVRPGSFVPPPKVDSAFVGLRLHPPPLPEEEMPDFERLLRAAFRQRRKTLLNSLTSSFSRPIVEEALATLGHDLKTRAEALGMADFLDLYRALRRRGAAALLAPGGILPASGNQTKP
ncbi:MAG: rRNA (adenine1518-N6/adenine1519-N6)-dimethyltransferase [Acidobacteriota bacterium]|nr:rRNA (adenine1518-N6/adenine1519-N6)-dimethyltransferase [Acidobacteriota bacterium]